MFAILVPEEIIRQILWCLPLGHHDTITLVLYSGRRLTLSKDRETIISKVRWLRRSLRRALRTHEPIEMLTAWIRDWVPNGYFTKATLLYRGEEIDLLARSGLQLRPLPSFRVQLNIVTPKIRPPRLIKGRGRARHGPDYPRRWKFAVQRHAVEELLHEATSFPE